MPVYNCKQFVQEAVNSILHQTFEDLELLIIDDVSTDGTYELLQQLTDPRIKLIQKQKNSGYTESLNMGLSIARGEFIARMDGDDISHPERFQWQVNFLNANPEIAICGTWFQIFSTDRIIKHPEENEKIKVALLNYCAIGHPTVIFRKSFFEENNLKYNREFEPAEDYDLWSRAVTLGKLANLPQVLLQYRVHNTQVSNSRAAIQTYNSTICKQRMLHNIFNDMCMHDKAMSELFFHQEKINNEAGLSKLMDWLDLLPEVNRKKLFFTDDDFRQYIKNSKRSVLTGFYFYQKPYNFKTLYQYTVSRKSNTELLSKGERLKFIAKCFIHWKSKT